MTAMRFVKRATVETASILGVVALAVSLVVDARAGLGVLAGGTLALVNLWWLTRRAAGAAPASASSAAGWSIAAGLRLAGVGAAVAILLASGLVHPVGVVAGLTVLPCVLIVRGLAAAREA
jgi:hypothetical protein